MRRAGKAAEITQAFEASGLTRQEFAARAGISVAMLDYRRARARADGPLVEVELTPALGWPGGAGVTLVLANGRRVELGAGFDAATFTRLLTLVETDGCSR